MVAFERNYLFVLEFHGQEDGVAPTDTNMEAEESCCTGNDDKEGAIVTGIAVGSERVRHKEMVSPRCSPTRFHTCSDSNLKTSYDFYATYHNNNSTNTPSADIWNTESIPLPNPRSSPHEARFRLRNGIY